ncbi:AraC family transcriptional regulator [Alkalitalea saponilacus]|uniref:AraC-like ligand binding domain-containing protein n=1 Tax=Alkalitalea saponilacus TaxID=889453 RepID=A0A1T5EVG4_9BACT|nr:AraC family transcriptional regulator [Alkalitalea saponilacus]ASB48010.1 AraC family transcriptional regulator [Alkalitalea saponilacus]SKB87945.1 AraC-like ligand binding domain-containing protein [Alkalitalea saponilacus]
MDDFFKYLTSSQEDKQWGIAFNVVGKATVEPGAIYPAPEHPNGYFFNWSSGRTLSEYQINYITEGSGILETKSEKHKIEAGTIMLIKPGVWHRYRPNKKTGWVEHYIGIEGDIIDRLFTNPILNAKSPVIKCGLKESVLDCYHRIFELAQKEKPGFQLISSGIAIRLLGSVVSHVKNRDFKGKPLEIAMEDAKFIMRDSLHQDLDFKELASSLNLGYSYFRKMFKKHTGVSPGQYHLHLRLMRAKELLLATDMPIKQVAYETGFDSIHYFSRLFKNKMGQPPSEMRNDE